MAIPFRAEARTLSTRGQLRTMRQQGNIPGVVYGTSLSKPMHVTVDEKELAHLLRTHPHSLLELDIPGAGKQPVMLNEVQREPVSRHVVHVDFHQVNMNETIKTPVRLEIIGDSVGVREGGILQPMLHELEIQCLPDRIPEMIEVNVASLGIGENLLLSDIQLPEGVTTKMDSDQVIVTILAPQLELSAEEAHDAAVEAHEAEQRAHEAEMHAVRFEK